MFSIARRISKKSYKFSRLTNTDVRFLSKNSLSINEELQDAVISRKPIVALESTIITHGMPFPQNLSTALKVEKIVRENNAIPATVGIIDGKLKVGLSEEEIKFLAGPGINAVKTSRRDLSYVLSQKLHGGTTVSATMVAAHQANIPIFVTGGIGGVHRHANQTFDISADLMELGRTPVTLVCAGVKSILDIGLTLEYLETQGVPVFTFGKSKCFPSFFTPASEFKAPYNIESIDEIARCIDKHLELELQNGMVVGVPIPDEYAASGKLIEDAIQTSLAEASDQNITGKEITPYVLSRVAELTKGASLEANIHLIENNAAVGSKIAVALSQIKAEKDTEYGNSRGISLSNKQHARIPSKSAKSSKRPVVIGGAAFDIKSTVETIDVIQEATNPGKVHIGYGGVGRNIADCLTRLNCNPLFIGGIGEDRIGEMLINDMRKLHMDTEGLIVSSNHSTACCSMVANNSGEWLMMIGDMSIHDTVTPYQIELKESYLKDASMVVLDSNIPADSIKKAIQICNKHQVPVWFEPTCVTKASKPFDDSNLRITYASPNVFELERIYSILNTNKNMKNIDWFSLNIEEIIQNCIHYAQCCTSTVDNMVVSLGLHGIVHIRRNGMELIVEHFQAARDDLMPVAVKSVSGAGDSFVGGMVYGLINGFTTELSIKSGLKAAYHSLHTYDPVSPDVCLENFNPSVIGDWASFNSKQYQN